MRDRSAQHGMLTACSLAILLAALGSTAVFGAEQAPKNWRAPRTADGQPDLQGVWTNATITPLERPAKGL